MFPEAVRDEKGHLSLSYQSLVGPMITGINELAAENADLAARVAKLEHDMENQKENRA